MKLNTAVAYFFMLGFIQVSFAGDRNPVFSYDRPSHISVNLLPEAQVEGFTCGLHALSSIYSSYGLSAQEFRLRDRTGVDVPTFPFSTDTKGTVHPDVIRILDQDGFASKTINLKTLEHKEMLEEHLNAGHPAMTLIKRKENGNLHWVVITKFENDLLTIADSLFPKSLYTEPYSPFAEENILSVILVNPSDSYVAKLTLWGNHGVGILGVVRAVYSDLFGFLVLVGIFIGHGVAVRLVALTVSRPLTFRRTFMVLGVAGGVWILLSLLIDGALGYAPAIILLLYPLVYTLSFKLGLRLSIREAFIGFVLSSLYFLGLCFAVYALTFLVLSLNFTH